MTIKVKPTTLNKYERYTLEALILEDHAIGGCFVDVCIGKQPNTDVPEETLALMEGRGLIRKTEFGWVLGSEGRNFARNLGLIPGPSDIETNPLTAIMKRKHLHKSQPKDIEQVWREFFSTRSAKSRNILLEYYLPLVKSTADGICAKLPDKVELDDLVSAGVFGLKDAIEAFEPKKNIKFEIYCTPRIRGSILDELRNMDWVPRLVRARAHHLDLVIQALEAQLGRVPTEKELAAAMNINMKEFHQFQQDTRAIGLLSLYNKVNENKSDINNREIDIIQDQRSPDPAIEAQKRDLKGLLTDGLNFDEKRIIILYYYKEMTLKEIGSQLNLSESRVSQMHSSIIARLKAQME